MSSVQGLAASLVQGLTASLVQGQGFPPWFCFHRPLAMLQNDACCLGDLGLQHSKAWPCTQQLSSVMSTTHKFGMCSPFMAQSNRLVLKKNPEQGALPLWALPCTRAWEPAHRFLKPCTRAWTPHLHQTTQGLHLLPEAEARATPGG